MRGRSYTAGELKAYELESGVGERDKMEITSNEGSRSFN